MATGHPRISPQLARLLLNNPVAISVLPRMYDRLVRRDQNSYTFHHNILIERRKAIYLFIPKVACSSLKLIFAREMGLMHEYEMDDNLPHAVNFPFAHSDELNDRFADYTTFAFVRNPWDRLTSCYMDKIWNRFHPGFKRYGILYPKMPFEEFIESICIIPDALSDSHFRSQTSFLNGRMSPDRIDFLGRFENLQDDFRRLSDMLRMAHRELPHIRRRQVADYRERYSTRTRNLVAMRFKNDVESFGYEF